MKRNFSIILSIFALAFVTLAASATANAQRREVRGLYLNKSQVKSIINRVETRVDYFVGQYDKALDRSRLDGSNREDWLNQRAKDLERATDDMRERFDRSDRWSDNKDEVRRCLNIATDIDRNMRKRKFGRNAETNWANVRFELNSLADVYNLPKVGSAAY